MAIKINKDEPSLSLYSWMYDSIPILELKSWVDTQIEKGMNNVTLELEWGYYDDIDAINVIAKK